MGIPLGPDAGPTFDERVCRILDECLSLPVLREFGLFDMCRKFLEMLKNVSFEWSESNPSFFGQPGLSDHGAVHERCQYLAGYRGYGDVSRMDRDTLYSIVLTR